MKLWQKEESIDKIFERFTVGKDPELDVYLAKYDVIGSRGKSIGSGYGRIRHYQMAK